MKPTLYITASSFIEFNGHYVPLKIQSSLDEQMMVVENAAMYSECTKKDVDIEKGKSETPIISEEALGGLKNEEEQMESWQKQISFEMGGFKKYGYFFAILLNMLHRFVVSLN